jgi:lipoprotein-anchoring transpeptidase ErfK/SrfK
MRTAATARAAVARRELQAFASPAGAVLTRFGRINVNGVPTVFGVLSARLDATCSPTWYRVQLPLRPNGRTGWVRARDVVVKTVDTRIVVDLSDRRVRLFKAGKPLLETVAAIGKPGTPTPTGSYYVNQRLLAADPSGPYGPGGIGISAFSPTLQNWVQGGPIAIHGTNLPNLLGEAVSHGCVRVDNAQLRRLMELAAEGTPVIIRN